MARSGATALSKVSVQKLMRPDRWPAVLIVCAVPLMALTTPPSRLARSGLNIPPTQEIFSPPSSELLPAATTVRVAAIQCYSHPGRIRANRSMLAAKIREAAAKGARLIVVPECAVQGYMNPVDDARWARIPEPDDGELDVSLVAETVPGASTRHFSELAREVEAWLAISLIEVEGESFYNTLVLIDPRGLIAAKHRKRSLWMHGDSGWASVGDGRAVVAKTPYGRVGLMICHDLHAMPPILKNAGVEIVLYSVGWYGANTASWFGSIFPERYVTPNGMAVVAANWSRDAESGKWQGQGYSTIYSRDGKVLAQAKDDRCEIIYADLPCSKSESVKEVNDE